ncbi:hypothetical protein [Primorskyibacter flagellatus]|uniref:hypothetical protein n=1 Tax=Primorskyibacter flagellatus TaxID=1387277 RepID=UPI003A8DEA7D
MTTRTKSLTEDFAKWLGRYSPRNSLKADPAALEAEMDALMRALVKLAPMHGHLKWLEKVTDQLDYQMKTVAWPTVQELGAVASNVNKSATRLDRDHAEWRLDPVAVNAKRINAGESVGDEWLYGCRAVELLRSGLVSQDQVGKYRAYLYASQKSAYGEDAARRMEDEAKQKHDDAAGIYRDVGCGPKRSPVKRMPICAEEMV